MLFLLIVVTDNNNYVSSSYDPSKSYSHAFYVQLHEAMQYGRLVRVFGVR